MLGLDPASGVPVVEKLWREASGASLVVGNLSGIIASGAPLEECDVVSK